MNDYLGYEHGYFKGQSKKSAVAYCHNPKHKGYLSLKNVKKHKCIQKGCFYFKKYKDHPYWVDKERQKKKRKFTERTTKVIKNGSPEEIAEYISRLLVKERSENG